MNRSHFGKATRAGALPVAADGLTRRHEAGKLAFGFGTEGVDCTIVDMSEFGAHVVGRLESSSIPRSVFLIHKRNRIAYECQVSWIDDNRLGLKFLKHHDLRNPDSPELKAMSAQCSIA